MTMSGSVFPGRPGQEDDQRGVHTNPAFMFGDPRQDARGDARGDARPHPGFDYDWNRRDEGCDKSAGPSLPGPCVGVPPPGGRGPCVGVPPPLEWSGVLQTFSQSTTAHGVSRIVQDTPFKLRRVIWTLLVLLGIFLFVLQMVQNTTYFMSRPVTVNVKVNYNRTMSFPAVTICNQNVFRLSRAVETGDYILLNELFDGTSHDFNFTKYNSSGVALKDLYKDLAHLKEDLIVDCHWNNAKCTADDFETVITDHGACASFNANKTIEPLAVSQTGADRGLRLQLNVEQYEYMRGPHNAAGLKILIHDQHEVPFVRDLGEAIPTGTTAFVGVRIMSVHNLKPPHGNCNDSHLLEYYETYSSSACRSTCRTYHALRECNCKDIYMPGNATDCTIEEYVQCIVPNVDMSTAVDEQCTCAVPCHALHFQTTVTYSSASAMSADSLLASDRAPPLQTRYRRARELLHRVDPRIVGQDAAQVAAVASRWEALGQRLQDVYVMMNATERAFEELLEDANWRASWHLKWGLERIKVAVERNYMRGWEVMDERTLAHVTTGFYQQAALFRAMVAGWDAGDAALSAAWWVATDRDLQYRQHMAAKSSDNFTVIHAAYSTGKPIYNFRLTPIYKGFDEYYAQDLLEFLQAESETKLYTRLHAYMVSYLHQISTLRTMARTLYENGTLDTAAMDAALGLFEKRSRNYNYYRYMYRETIILKSASAAQERVNYFLALNDTMQGHVDDLRLSLGNIRELLDNFEQNSRSSITDAVSIANQYVTNTTIEKSSLAAILTSKKMADVLHGAETFYKDMHTRGQQLRDAWGHFRVSCERVWLTILRETSLRSHYQHIRRTVFRAFLPNETDFRQTIMPQLAEMVGLPVSQFLAESLETVVRRTNADIAVLNETLLVNLLEVKFEAVRDHMSQLDQLTGSSEAFFSEMETLQDQMRNFLQTVTIDTGFFKDNFLQLNVFMSDLSYEEIDQQVAYDMIALISDIGGSMGFFIGASVMTVFEIIDVFVHTVFLMKFTKKEVQKT